MYGFNITLTDSFDNAVKRVTEALKTEGFGVLTDIDVQATMKAKLNVDGAPYRILGACNPPLAHKALTADPDIGLLLPCNVIVYETASEQSVVAAMAPLAALGVVGPNPALQEVAREADERLRRALTALKTAASK